jgi:hypothetical protein
LTGRGTLQILETLTNSLARRDVACHRLRQEIAIGINASFRPLSNLGVPSLSDLGALFQPASIAGAR